MQLTEVEVYTPDDLARMLKVTTKWVEKYTQKRCVPGQFKAGGVWRYRKRDVELALCREQFLEG